MRKQIRKAGKSGCTDYLLNSKMIAIQNLLASIAVEIAS
jgi:hypothetical protein